MTMDMVFGTGLPTVTRRRLPQLYVSVFLMLVLMIMAFARGLTSYFLMFSFRHQIAVNSFPLPEKHSLWLKKL